MEYFVWVFVVFGLLVLNQLAGLARSLRSLQDLAPMLRLLLAHRGIPWGERVEPSAKVRALALDKKTYVEAIKAYREQTGLDLREAKAAIDELRVRPHVPAAPF